MTAAIMTVCKIMIDASILRISEYLSWKTHTYYFYFYEKNPN